MVNISNFPLSGPLKNIKPSVSSIISKAKNTVHGVTSRLSIKEIIKNITDLKEGVYSSGEYTLTVRVYREGEAQGKKAIGLCKNGELILSYDGKDNTCHCKKISAIEFRDFFRSYKQDGIYKRG